jgi:hypothetical protein
VTLPEPELDEGADGACDTPLPDVELLELLPEFELPVLELPDEPLLEEPVLEEPVLEEPVLDEPVLGEPLVDELLVEAAPGRAKATAAAATALTTPAVTVTARSRVCPRSRAAMARRVSCGGPFMGGVPASLASWQPASVPGLALASAVPLSNL